MDDNKSESNGDYEVGFGRPPEHTQFKKGVSGNPNGRPRSPTSFQAVVRQMGDSMLPTLINGQEMTYREAVVMQLYTQAVKGQLRAILIIDEIEKRIETPTDQTGAYYPPVFTLKLEE
jgi:hypothetical protein